MKVTQTKILRLIDDDRIGIRNINATFNNSSCKEYVIVIVDKIKNDFLQFGRFHLPVSNCHTTVRDMAFNHRF